MKVAQYALPRSGSTLVLQVLMKTLGRDNVDYSHKFRETNLPLIITLRDFRDTVASYWRIWHGKLENGKIINTPTYEEVKSAIGSAVARINQLNQYQEYYKNKNVLWLRYEDFFDNYEYLFNEIEKFLDITVSTKKREQIIKETNLEAKRKYQTKIPINPDKKRIFDNYEDCLDIHANHIHPTIKPSPGYWKEVFPKEFHGLIEFALEEQLVRWGYWNIDYSEESK